MKALGMFSGPHFFIVRTTQVTGPRISALLRFTRIVG